MEALLLFGIFLEVCIILYIAQNAAKGLQVLLLSLAGFWFIGFLVRPLIFIYSRNHYVDSSLFDPRLGQSSQDFKLILISIIVGNALFCTPLLLQVNLSPKIKQTSAPHESVVYVKIIAFCITCGFLSFLIEQTPFRNPFSKSLTPLIYMGFLVYIWKRKDLKLSKQSRLFFITSGCCGTLLLFSSANNSKGILLTPLLFFMATLRRLDSNQKKYQVVIVGILIFSFLIPAFSALQSYKFRLSGQESTHVLNESLPWYLSPFAILANRFDQFSRVVDVHFAAPGSLGGFGSWGNYLLRSLEWNPISGRSELSFGQQWNFLVTNQSISGARLSHVSLAQGMIAEGLIWSGFKSLILECFIFAFIFIWIGNLLEKGPLSNLLAFGLIGNSIIFEAGLVQFAEIISSTLKAMLFVAVSHYFLFKSKGP